MSESNIKSEIRTNEQMLNTPLKETLAVVQHMFRPDLSIADVMSTKTAFVSASSESLDSGAGNLDTLDMIEACLSLVANARYKLRTEGHGSIADTGSGSSVYGYYFVAGTDFYDIWHQYFLEGFHENSSLSVGTSSIDWSNGSIEDLIRRWAYLKGLEYSNLHSEIKSTEKITLDKRKDYDIVVRLLSLDGFEEWINIYIDAIIQSEKALLNIGAAELRSLGRADLKSLFNEDVNIPTIFLSLAATEWSDVYRGGYTTMPKFDYTDLITRTNVQELYDSFNQKYMRPSASLNFAQKYFGMGTTEDKLGFTRHLLHLVSVGQESAITPDHGTGQYKVGYGLNYAIKMLENFYGSGEKNIAKNRALFLERTSHWSTKSFADIFKKQFYTVTSPMIVKGLLDVNVYAPVHSAFMLRSTPVIDSTGVTKETNSLTWNSGKVFDMVLHNDEDRTSVIRVDNQLNDWNLNSVSDWFVLNWLLSSSDRSTNNVIQNYVVGFTRAMSGDTANVLTFSGDADLNTSAERDVHGLFFDQNNSVPLVGYPELINITNTGKYVSNGLDTVLIRDGSVLSHEEFIIYNAYGRDTVRNLILLGLGTSKSEAKASPVMSAEDNDNDNDGDDSS